MSLTVTRTRSGCPSAGCSDAGDKLRPTVKVLARHTARRRATWERRADRATVVGKSGEE